MFSASFFLTSQLICIPGFNILFLVSFKFQPYASNYCMPGVFVISVYARFSYKLLVGGTEPSCTPTGQLCIKYSISTQRMDDI